MANVIEVDGEYCIVENGKALQTRYSTRHDAEEELAFVEHCKREQAMEQGMLHGVHAYNSAMGYDLSAPEPCGHHCIHTGCRRCTDW